jgi:AcrR family transcriptional regulator
MTAIPYSGPVATRSYRSDLRTQQAELTRGLIAEAARAAFLEHGWAGTSIRTVAERAGVSDATVYAVFGSKAGLALGLVDTIDARADVERIMAELKAAAGDPPAQLAAFVGFDRRLYERGGDVLRLLVEAGRHQPELAKAQFEGRRRGELNRRRIFSSWPARDWRRGVDTERAIDIYAVTVNIGTYDEAVEERGWRPDDIEEWWRTSLTELLLRPRAED